MRCQELSPGAYTGRPVAKKRSGTSGPVSLGELVLRARKRLGLTQGELARRLGYRTYLSVLRIERGFWLPSAARLDKWFDVLELPESERKQARQLWQSERSPLVVRDLTSRTSEPQVALDLKLDVEMARTLRVNPELRRVFATASTKERRELRGMLARRLRDELVNWAARRLRAP
jgi:transcriptional regulator with XRE-family HTH domain